MKISQLMLFSLFGTLCCFPLSVTLWVWIHLLYCSRDFCIRLLLWHSAHRKFLVYKSFFCDSNLKWQKLHLLFTTENPRDGGAWWAAVYGVAQSRTRLKRLSSSSSSTVSMASDKVSDAEGLIWMRESISHPCDRSSKTRMLVVMLLQKSVRPLLL